MSSIEITLIIALIGFGIYCTYLLNAIKDYEEREEETANVIIGMAHELEDLGSPNVKITRSKDEDPS